MKVKLCIDPGHGMGNRKPGVYDPGAEGGGKKEADIALAFALTLKAECVAAGIETWMTRYDDRTPDPVGTRDDRAEAQGCTHFIAIHCNSADSESATGTEVFYRDAADQKLASIVLGAALTATGLRSRGMKGEGQSQHTSLAVFGFDGPACLIELGFISNPADREKMLSRDVRIRFADGVIAGLKAHYGIGGKA